MSVEKEIADLAVRGMKRQHFNREILRVLTAAVESNPELRFHQLLWALNMTERENGGVKDKFYEESDTTYHKLTACLASMK